MDGGHKRKRILQAGGFLQNYKLIATLLRPVQKRRWLGLMGIAASVGLLESIGVLSILPFLAVLTDPGIVNRPGILSTVYKTLGFSSLASFQMTLGALAFMILVVGVGARIWRIVLHTRFVRAQAVYMSTQLLRSSLARPYSWFLASNSSDISASVLSEVEKLVSGSISSSIELVANLAVSVSVLTILFVANPVSAAVVCLVFGGAYGVVWVVARSYLSRYGAKRLKANRARFSLAAAMLGGIKEVKLHAREETFLEMFQGEAEKAARARAAIMQITAMPRNMLEILVFGATIGLLLFILARQNASLMEMIPLIGLFAFAGVRLLPVIQSLYRAVAILTSDTPTLVELAKNISPESDIKLPVAAEDRLSLTSSIELRDVVFNYETHDALALKLDALHIPARKVTAIAGPSGSGKSTLIDILLGLLQPTDGKILIDGIELTEDNRRAWQANVGYVPQDVYLIDDTIAANISFARDPANDIERIRSAARAAAVDSFVSGLPKGYETTVGERGVRLSGGQAQRIAIARALYGAPQVLILDEPTSALDGETEQSVLDAITQQSQSRTVLIVTHRETTVAQCDHVIRIRGGRLETDISPETAAIEKRRQNVT